MLLRSFHDAFICIQIFLSSWLYLLSFLSYFFYFFYFLFYKNLVFIVLFFPYFRYTLQPYVTMHSLCYNCISCLEFPTLSSFFHIVFIASIYYNFRIILFFITPSSMSTLNVFLSIYFGRMIRDSCYRCFSWSDLTYPVNPPLLTYPFITFLDSSWLVFEHPIIHFTVTHQSQSRRLVFRAHYAYSFLFRLLCYLFSDVTICRHVVNSFFSVHSFNLLYNCKGIQQTRRFINIRITIIQSQFLTILIL